MSDCNVCLSGFDGEGVDMYHAKIVAARKPHGCEECGKQILPGEKYERASGLQDGKWWHFNTCLICANIRTKFSCGEGWLHGVLWDDMYESVLPGLTTGCLEGLSVEAKKVVLDHWNRWKGLTA